MRKKHQSVKLLRSQRNGMLGQRLDTLFSLLVSIYPLPFLGFTFYYKKGVMMHFLKAYEALKFNGQDAHYNVGPIERVLYQTNIKPAWLVVGLMIHGIICFRNLVKDSSQRPICVWWWFMDEKDLSLLSLHGRNDKGWKPSNQPVVVQNTSLNPRWFESILIFFFVLHWNLRNHLIGRCLYFILSHWPSHISHWSWLQLAIKPMQHAETLGEEPHVKGIFFTFNYSNRD